MLIDSLKTYMGTNYVFYVKVHGFHWNLEGIHFYEFHKLFEDIYVDTYNVVDTTAEYIRSLDEYAPGAMSRFLELSVLEEQTKIPKLNLMIKELLSDNDKILELLKDLFDEATEARENGIANFIADRQSMHGKWHWQLRASLQPE
jgi:starvation-inducible DNA-binding protein